MNGGSIEALPLSPSALRAVAVRLVAAGETLRTLDLDRRAHALCKTAALLRDADTKVGRSAGELLASSTGLSAEMVRWGLETTLREVDLDAVRRLVDHASRSQVGTPQPARLAVVVLASNLFTAAVRAIFTPLALGVPVLAKGSSRDDRFAWLLKRALSEVDDEVASAFELLSFAGERSDLLQAAFAEADVASVYGSDATIAAVGALLPPTARLLPHGHGIGAAFLPSSETRDEQACLAAMRSLALDIAAYDQRGCLSPQFVCIEGTDEELDRAGRYLYEALAELALRLPRGALPTTIGAAQMQWRGVSKARGTLLEGDGFSICIEADSTPRLGPGYRNIALLPCGGHEDLIERLLPYGRHLKALGVGGGRAIRQQLARSLPSPLSPAISALGEMQTPPFDAAADGLPGWSGFLSSVELR